MLTDTEFIENIRYFSLLPHLGLSDHQCLSLSLKIGYFFAETTTEVNIIKERPLKYASPDEFVMKLNSPPLQEKLKNFVQAYSTPSAEIEEMTTDLVDILTTSCAKSPSLKNKKNKRRRKKRNDKPPWFSSECKNLKWSLNKANKEFRKHPFNVTKKEALFSIKKKFKSLCKASERAFRNKLSAQLLAAQPNIFSLNVLKSIFKKEDPSNPDNYRGIATGSVIAKVFNLIILGRLEGRVINDQLLNPNQIGFKKGHQTSDHIFVLNSIVNKIVRNEKRKLFVAFIDFKKAFDKVNCNLLFKLQKLGIKGLLYRNIKEICKSIYYIVKVRGNSQIDMSSLNVNWTFTF